MVWYKETAQEVMKTLKTTPDGLNQDDQVDDSCPFATMNEL